MVVKVHSEDEVCPVEGGEGGGGRAPGVGRETAEVRGLLREDEVRGRGGRGGLVGEGAQGRGGAPGVGFPGGIVQASWGGVFSQVLNVARIIPTRVAPLTRPSPPSSLSGAAHPAHCRAAGRARHIPRRWHIAVWPGEGGTLPPIPLTHPKRGKVRGGHIRRLFRLRLHHPLL